MAKSAMFNRYAMNAKRASEKKMFDADKARKRLEKNSPNWKDSRDTSIQIKRYKRMKKALEGFQPIFSHN